MTKPRLSVIMANYNHGRYIKHAIESVLAQSRLPDEYLILDDGSTDESTQIIQYYADQHPFIHFFRNDHNQGMFPAWGRLMSMVNGDYVYGGAADDFILPDFFEKAMHMAQKYPLAGSIVGDCVVIDKSGQEIDVITSGVWSDSIYVTPDLFLNDYLFKSKPTHSFVSAVIYKKKCLEEVGGFREELGFWCDTFAFRAIGLSHGICYINHRCACWRVMPNSVCHSTIRDPKKEFDIFRRLIGLMKSQEFKHTFPSEYIKKWSAEYKKRIINRALRQLDENNSPIYSQFWHNYNDSSTLSWILKRLLWRFDLRYRKLFKYLLKHSLERYVRNIQSSENQKPEI